MRGESQKSLVGFNGTVRIPAIGKFVVSDHFIRGQDTGREVKVDIFWMGNNFANWFLEKVEEPIGAKTLSYYKLLRSSLDGPIIDALGGEEIVEVTLGRIFFLMKKQVSEVGVLLTNSCANIFYARDINNVLRAIYVRWYDGAWRINSDSCGSPYKWLAGHRVFAGRRA